MNKKRVRERTYVEKLAFSASKYSPELLKYIKPVMANGGSAWHLCAKLDISMRTHETWMEIHPEYAEEVEKAEALSRVYWMDSGANNLDNTEYSYQGYSYQMRNRFGWRAKDAEVTIVAGTNSTDEDISAAVKKMERLTSNNDDNVQKSIAKQEEVTD